ncbi:M56 family metallopeptidase [Flavobacterium litorale]|uniref:Peptidase M56 domain-containing protein n=1 Tax=Flavobacterium litorale TaxID=2856519 RepID=A0ABX8V5X2_9FLAO|nr:M56 family metallopeptidase [Flavobacterium litorale]QYJ67892.1 hypothetical protein K1I41_10120 [Flavobacterium litorale]
MESLIIYLIKASGLLTIFYVAYYFLLRKETFFTANRKFLLAGLITSAIFPLLVFTRTVLVEVTEQVPMQEISIEQLMAMQQVPTNTAESINWYSIIGIVYCIGLLFFTIRFIADIKTIKSILKGKQVLYKNGFKYIDCSTIQSPFSFFNYIVYNSTLLTPQELQNILSHEQVHSAQKHSLDMVISQLFCIVFWFNPFVWGYKKAISQNLEFIADAEATKQVDDIKAYQKTLLKITVQPECTAIINHFYQSLIKKRIVMLNKQESKVRNSWKYAVVLPILVAFMVLFQLEIKAQVSPTPISKTIVEKKVTEGKKVSTAVVVSKDTKEEDFEAFKSIFKKSYDANVAFKKIQRNNNGEITSIYISVKDKDTKNSYPVREIFPNNEGKPIPSIAIEISNSGEGSKNQVRFRDVTPTTKERKHTKVYKYTNVNQAPPLPPTVKGNWSVNGVDINSKDMLIVIDGVEQKKGEPIQLPLHIEISTMNVLDKKAAKKKYGRKARKGAIEITTQKKESETIRVINGNGTSDILIEADHIHLRDLEGEIARIETLSELNLEGIGIDIDNHFDNIKLLDSLSDFGIDKIEMEKLQEQLKDAREDFFDSNEKRTLIIKQEQKLKEAQEEMKARSNKMRIKVEKATTERLRAFEEREKALVERQKVLEERERALEERKKAIEKSKQERQ